MRYAEKFKDPRWQKKRLKILERDEFTCQICYDKETTLHVHHRYYIRGAEPWDYPDDALVTLCENCHEIEGEEMPRIIRTLEEELKKQFFSNQVIDIAHGFYCMGEKNWTLKEKESFLTWVFSEMDVLREECFRYIKERPDSLVSKVYKSMIRIKEYRAEEEKCHKAE